MVVEEGDGFHWLQRCCVQFLPEGQAVNKTYYVAVMKRLRDAIRRKRPDLWANYSWILHHDNAPSYNAILVRSV